MNKYYCILDKILSDGKWQKNKKGSIKYLLNQQLALSPADCWTSSRVTASHGRS